MKRLAIIAATATAVTVLAALAVTASAAPGANKVTSIVCPDKSHKGRWGPIGARGDDNENGAVCMRGNKIVDDEKVFTTSIYGSGGRCPGKYIPTLTIYAPNDYDENKTGVVCFKPNGQGSWVDDVLVLNDDSGE
jgi:hypothetical protein